MHDFRVFGDNSSQPDQTAKHFSEPISKLLTAAKTLKTHNLFCNSSREQESSQKIVVVIIVVVVVVINNRSSSSSSSSRSSSSS